RHGRGDAVRRQAHDLRRFRRDRRRLDAHSGCSGPVWHRVERFGAGLAFRRQVSQSRQASCVPRGDRLKRWRPGRAFSRTMAIRERMPMLSDDFEVIDPRFSRLVFGNVHLEKLYTGCRWAEGPAYFPAGRYLIWSDIPNNRIMRWDETDG